MNGKGVTGTMVIILMLVIIFAIKVTMYFGLSEENKNYTETIEELKQETTIERNTQIYNENQHITIALYIRYNRIFKR